MAVTKKRKEKYKSLEGKRETISSPYSGASKYEKERGITIGGSSAGNEAQARPTEKELLYAQPPVMPEEKPKIEEQQPIEQPIEQPKSINVEGQELPTSEALTELPQDPTTKFLRTPLPGAEDFANSLGVAGAIVPTTPIEIGADIATVGAASAVIKAARAAMKAVKAARAERSIQKLATIFNKDPEKIEWMVKRAELKGGVDAIVKSTSVKKIAAGVAIGGLLVGKQITETDTMLQWYALDNVIGQQSIYVRDLVNNAKFGQTTPEEALKEAKESMGTRDIAIQKIIKSNTINPTLWAQRKLILAGVNQDTEILFARVRELEEMAATQKQTTENKRPTQKKNPETGEWENV